MNVWILWDYWMWETWEQVITLMVCFVGFFTCIQMLNSIYYKATGKQKALKGKVLDDDDDDDDDYDDW